MNTVDKTNFTLAFPVNNKDNDDIRELELYLEIEKENQRLMLLSRPESMPKSKLGGIIVEDDTTITIDIAKLAMYSSLVILGGVSAYFGGGFLIQRFGGKVVGETVGAIVSNFR